VQPPADADNGGDTSGSQAMKLYCDPISTTSRAVLLFLAEEKARGGKLNVEVEKVDLMTGAAQTPAYKAINPNCAVPALADGDFVVTEASAILKYLAEVGGSPAYPAGDVKARARINQRMDWFNTGFYKDFGYGMVYSQTFPNHKYPNATTQSEYVAKSTERACNWLNVLEGYLGEHPYVCGDSYTIGDSMAAAYLSVADWVKFDLARWPNITRYLAAMRARASWAEVNAPFDGLTQYFQSQLAGATA
jgi:glutathione S-transferase